MEERREINREDMKRAPRHFPPRLSPPHPIHRAEAVRRKVTKERCKRTVDEITG